MGRWACNGVHVPADEGRGKIMKTMTAIELIADTLRTGIVECGDFNCYDCPFGADREIHLCHSWHDEDARREGLKQMLFAAVDEARKEETEPTVGQIWKRKSGFGDQVEITRIVNNLNGTKEVRYSMDDGRFISGAAIEDFLKRFEKCEEEKNSSHTTPDHYRLNPEPIAVIKAWDLGFCLGNVIKYIARAGHKAGESRDKDLHKAMEYLRMELEDQADAKESTAARRCC